MNLSSKHLRQLLKSDAGGTHLSIYLPTHPFTNSQALNQDTIRLKNALKEIKNSPNYDERELGDVVKSLYELVDDIEFWKQQDVGLAIFANSQGIEHYNLPLETTEATYIEDGFVISPLAVMHSIGAEFYVLDVNLTKPRLLKSSHGTLVVVNDENTPTSFQDETARDEYKAELQHRAAPRGGGGDNKFHGHSPSAALDHDTAKYLSLVASTVDEFMVDRDQPLLLVGEQSRVGNLRPNLRYEQLLPQGIDGNYEAHTPQDLYDTVIETMQNYDREQRRERVDQLLASESEMVVSGDRELAEAASSGRIEYIYVPAYRRTTDSVRPGDSVSIILQLPSDISGFEPIIRDVLSHDGSVVAVEIDAYPELDGTKALVRFS